MRAEPQVKRTVVFVDGQNLYHAAREAFGYTYPNFDALALARTDLDDFVACFAPENRHERTEAKRLRAFAYDELVKRDKANLDIFWLKDASLEESANLPDPDIIAAEIVEDLHAALEQFSALAEDLTR